MTHRVLLSSDNSLIIPYIFDIFLNDDIILTISREINDLKFISQNIWLFPLIVFIVHNVYHLDHLKYV